MYPCLQGNNVSCRLACPTYGRVTCLTYQNIRACEQYLRDMKKYQESNAIDHSMTYLTVDQFDALRYSGKAMITLIDHSAALSLAVLALGILLCASILSILIYFVRKRPSYSLFSRPKRSLHRLATRPTTSMIPRTRYTTAPDVNQLPILSYSPDSYEPPPYPGPSRSDSIYYETIKTPNVLNSRSTLPDRMFQSHCV